MVRPVLAGVASEGEGGRERGSQHVRKLGVDAPSWPGAIVETLCACGWVSGTHFGASWNQALWRTRRYVERKSKWAEGGVVRPTETTERERIEERRRKAVEEDAEKERVERERKKAGSTPLSAYARALRCSALTFGMANTRLLLRVDLAVGTGKV